MSTSIIFFFAIGVFFLMVVGIFLTMQEFNRLTDDPSRQKGVVPAPGTNQRGVDATDTA